jgi:ABC-type sugar transport system ATPase subunit
METAMIRMENVSRTWPEFSIRDITLEVKRGEYLVVVGPTGAGKTLLLELLLGIHQPDQGRILVDGKDVTPLAPEKRAIGMVYQDYLLFPHLDVARNLAFGLHYHRCSPEDSARRVREMAALLGIEHLLHRYPSTLSGGEKQRVAMGRALVTEPRVLLLDEPLSALDRRTANRLRAELKHLHETKGLTVIHVTHDLAEARQMGGPIALINEGQLNAYGTADEMMRRPPNIFAANFFGAVNLYERQLVADCFLRSTDPWIMIRPDEVTLLPASSEPGPDVLHGKIAGLLDEGNYVAVRIQVDRLPDSLTVYATRQTVRAHSLELGTRIAADVSQAIHGL